MSRRKTPHHMVTCLACRMVVGVYLDTTMATHSDPMFCPGGCPASGTTAHAENVAPVRDGAP